MLAFNLGIFFRNLHGQPVAFDAKRAGAAMHFVGTVESLDEKTALVNHLAVVLACDDLRMEMSFDEGDEPEGEDNPEVKITLIRIGMAEPLFEASFAFDEIRLQPVEPETGVAEEPAAEPIAHAKPRHPAPPAPEPPEPA